MTKKATLPRATSDAARERMREAALARYERDAQQTHQRVREMLKTIQEEIATNGGIYPNNKGAVSLAEVARRSTIHPFTFHKPRYVELAAEVKAWLKTLKEGSVVGRVQVRKELGTRVQEWKQLYEDLLETHRLSETDLKHALERLEATTEEIRQLRERLSAQSELKVVPMRPLKKE
jgi:phosphoribosylformimino-5-aminoimidazole carboxamide ribonucleotide (ProFAR) isomerase